MKLIKYLLWILLLMGSLVFLVQLNELNQFEGNMGVIFDKGNAQPKDIVDILIQDAKGVSLFGNRVLKKEKIYEIN